MVEAIKKLETRRVLALFLTLVIVVGIIPMPEVGAAGPYGTNYPPHDTKFKNTVIVYDGGEYIAFQTASNIYYASDKGYLMVDGQSIIRKMRWRNERWEQLSIYVAEQLIRSVVIGLTNVHLYSISNDKVNSEPKAYPSIVDNNCDIINYNSVEETDAMSMASSDDQIAEFGAAMFPSPYTLIKFATGDNSENVYKDFELTQSFTFGDLVFYIDWASSDLSAIDITKPMSGGSVNYFSNAMATVSRQSEDRHVALQFTVLYGNGRSATQEIDLLVPGVKYTKTQNWISNLDVDSFFVWGAENNGFQNVTMAFTVKNKVGDYVLESLQEVSAQSLLLLSQNPDSGNWLASVNNPQRSIVVEYLDAVFTSDSDPSLRYEIRFAFIVEALVQDMPLQPDGQLLNLENISPVGQTSARERMLQEYITPFNAQPMSASNAPYTLTLVQYDSTTTTPTGKKLTATYDSTNKQFVFNEINTYIEAELDNLRLYTYKLVVNDCTWQNMVIKFIPQANETPSDSKVKFDDGKQAGGDTSGKIWDGSPVPVDIKISLLPDNIYKAGVFDNEKILSQTYNIDAISFEFYNNFEIKLDTALDSSVNAMSNALSMQIVSPIQTWESSAFNASGTYYPDVKRTTRNWATGYEELTPVKSTEWQEINASHIGSANGNTYLYFVLTFNDLKEIAGSNNINGYFKNNSLLGFETFSNLEYFNSDNDNGAATGWSKITRGSNGLFELWKPGYTLNQLLDGAVSVNTNENVLDDAGEPIEPGEDIMIPFRIALNGLNPGENKFEMLFFSKDVVDYVNPDVSVAFTITSPFEYLIKEGPATTPGDNVIEETLFYSTVPASNGASNNAMKTVNQNNVEIELRNDTGYNNAITGDFQTMPSYSVMNGFYYGAMKRVVNLDSSKLRADTNSIIGYSAYSAESKSLSHSFFDTEQAFYKNNLLALTKWTKSGKTAEGTDNGHPNSIIEQFKQVSAAGYEWLAYATTANESQTSFDSNIYSQNKTNGVSKAIGDPLFAYKLGDSGLSSANLSHSINDDVNSTSGESSYTIPYRINLNELGDYGEHEFIASLVDSYTLVKDGFQAQLEIPDASKETEGTLSEASLVINILDPSARDSYMPKFKDYTGNWNVEFNFTEKTPQISIQSFTSNMEVDGITTIDQPGMVGRADQFVIENRATFEQLQNTQSSQFIRAIIKNDSYIAGWKSAILEFGQPSDVFEIYELHFDVNGKLVGTPEKIDFAGNKAAIQLVPTGQLLSPGASVTKYFFIRNVRDISDDPANPSTITVSFKAKDENDKTVYPMNEEPEYSADYNIYATMKNGNADIEVAKISRFEDISQIVGALNKELGPDGQPIVAKLSEPLFGYPSQEIVYTGDLGLYSSSYSMVYVRNDTAIDTLNSIIKVSDLSNSPSNKIEIVGKVILRDSNGNLILENGEPVYEFVPFENPVTQITTGATPAKSRAYEAYVVRVATNSTDIGQQFSIRYEGELVLNDGQNNKHIKAENLDVSYTIRINPFNDFVDNVSRLFANRPGLWNQTTSINGINAVNSDYFFLDLPEGLSSQDVISDIGLSTYWNGMPIIWTFNRAQGDAQVGVVSEAGTYMLKIYERGTVDTYVELIGTFNYFGKSLQVSIPVRIPASNKWEASSLDITNGTDYVGAYILVDGYYVVSENVGVVGSSEVPNAMFKFNVDPTRLAPYNIYVGSRRINSNGWAVPTSSSSTYKLSTSLGSAYTPVGATLIGNTIIYQHNTSGAAGSFVVQSTRNYSNYVGVIIDKNLSFVIRDGSMYKYKTYTSSVLFLGKYPVPPAQITGSSHFIVLDLGEYVALLTSSAGWTTSKGGNGYYTGSESGATVKIYKAPNWEEITTIEGVVGSTFGTFESLLYTNGDIKDSEGEVVILKNPSIEWIRAPGANTAALPDANAYFVLNETTYVAYKAANGGQVSFWSNETFSWGLWTDMAAVNMTLADLDSLRALIRVEKDDASYDEISAVIEYPSRKINLPVVTDSIRTGITSSANGNYTILDTEVDGIRLVVHNGMSTTPEGYLKFDSAREFSFNGTNWVLLDTGGDSLNDDDTYNNIRARYWIICDYDGMYGKFNGNNAVVDFFVPPSSSVFPSLPRPTVSGNAVLIFRDGEYVLYSTSNQIFTTIGDEALYMTGGGTLMATAFRKGVWTSVPSLNIVAGVVDGKARLGIRASEVIWSNSAIVTEGGGSVKIGASPLNMFPQSATGYLDLPMYTESGKKYYIWDKSDPGNTFLVRFDPVIGTAMAPIYKPDTAKTPAPINLFDDSTESILGDKENAELSVEYYLPNFMGAAKLGSLLLDKTTSDGVNSNSRFFIKNTSKNPYQTNIGDIDWPDSVSLLPDTEAPQWDEISAENMATLRSRGLDVPFAYMLYRELTWGGYDSIAQQARQRVTGLNVHSAYGIRFDKDFTLSSDFDAWILKETVIDGYNTSYSWVEVHYDAYNYTLLDPSNPEAGWGIDDMDTTPNKIPAGDTIYWLSSGSLQVFNDAAEYEDNLGVTLYRIDDAYNISSGFQVTLDKEKQHQEILNTPEEIVEEMYRDDGDTTSDINAPTIEYIYMYRGSLYIVGDDISINGRNVSGLADYPYVIISSESLAGDVVGNETYEGYGTVITKIDAGIKSYLSSGLIPIGTVNGAITLSIGMVDRIGNETSPLRTVTIDPYSNNTIIYGDPPEYIRKMVEDEFNLDNQAGTDTVAPVIKAIYTGVVNDRPILGVVATDNSGRALEYKYELRTSGTIDWSGNSRINVLTQDTGVVRVYVRDAAGNEASATAFLETGKAAIIAGEEGDVPPKILEELGISKSDTTPPVITSVYVYKGMLYINGYDNVGLHNYAYGWKPLEDMTIRSDFYGYSLDGLPIEVKAGKLVKNGTLMFNAKNSQEIQVPMSFEIQLRDKSGNISTMSFFITDDNMLLFGTVPPELEGILGKDEDEAAKEAEKYISIEDNYILVKMHDSFKDIDWNVYDYELYLYDENGRLVYSLVLDDGGQAILPLLTSGKDSKVVQKAVSSVTGDVVLDKELVFKTADTTAPVITRTYVSGGRLYVEAYDNLELAAEPYSMTVTNAAANVLERFTKDNSKKVLDGDVVRVTVKDSADLTTSIMVVIDGEGELVRNLNPTKPLVFRYGETKTQSEFIELFKKTYGVSGNYEFEIDSNRNASMIELSLTDATIIGKGIGVIEIKNKDTGGYLHVTVKVLDNGKAGRSAIVQVNSATNFLLLFKDTLTESFGSINGISWSVGEGNISKDGELFTVSKVGIYKITATKSNLVVNFYIDAEENIKGVESVFDFAENDAKYTYAVGETILLSDIFSATDMAKVGTDSQKIVTESISSGISRSNNTITITTAGRKTISILNVVTDQSTSIQFEVVTVKPFVPEYSDISESYARDDIARLAQFGILEKSSDNKFKPNNPISTKEFMSLLNKFLYTMNVDADYQRTNSTFALSRKDYDYFSVLNIAGYMDISTLMSVIPENDPLTTPITRGQAVVLLSETILKNEHHAAKGGNMITDITSNTVMVAVEHLASLNIVDTSEGLFRPNDNLTRQEMASLLGKAAQYLE